MRSNVLALVVACSLVYTPRARAWPADSTATTLDAQVEGLADSASPSPTQEINTTRLAIVGGTVLGVMTGVQIYQANGWWKDNRSSFHFREDLSYGLGVDKLGHFYAASGLTFIFSKSLQWANFTQERSLFWGAGTAILFQTYVEIQDGFSTWGFDRVDFATNLAGASYPLIQYHVPFLQSFNMKMSYHPSPLVNEGGGIGFKGQKHIIVDDYEGQTIWFSFNVNNLLPKSADPYWPDWLCVSLGYGARDIATSNPYPIWLIAFDYDMTKIIPQTSSFLRTLSETLNFIHLPAPAVRISPNAIWYGVYF